MQALLALVPKLLKVDKIGVGVTEKGLAQGSPSLAFLAELLAAFKVCARSSQWTALLCTYILQILMQHATSRSTVFNPSLPLRSGSNTTRTSQSVSSTPTILAPMGTPSPLRSSESNQALA
jgi:hypothetical protein